MNIVNDEISAILLNVDSGGVTINNVSTAFFWIQS